MKSISSEHLRVFGAVIGGLGLLILVGMGIIMTLKVQQFGQQEGLEVLRQVKPLLRPWMYAIVTGLTMFSGGIVLYLAGDARRRTEN